MRLISLTLSEAWQLISATSRENKEISKMQQLPSIPLLKREKPRKVFLSTAK